VVHQAVTDYVEGLGSYRMLARTYSRRLSRDVSRSALNAWVAAAGAAAMTPLEMSRRLAPPGWGGWVGIDGKRLRIGSGDEATLMVAVDQTSTDLIHARVVDHESGDVFAHMLMDLVQIGYPLAGVVADLGSGPPRESFPQACADYFGDLPFQACRVHFARRMDQLLSTPRHQPDAGPNAELKQAIRNILFAPSYQTAVDAYHRVTTDTTRYTSRPARTILRSLRRTIALHLTHHQHRGLPADANITENVVRTLNRKLAPMEHCATRATTDHYTRLLAANYRWKRFTDSSNGRNGHSPLELAGVTLPTDHWLPYLQQTHST
jgi:hypothetical protein